MRSLQELQRLLTAGHYSFSRHAFRRAVERNIAEHEIREAGNQASMIENYPADKYAASCVLLGWTAAGRPLHLQVSRAEVGPVRIITLYEPDPGMWDASYAVRR